MKPSKFIKCLPFLVCLVVGVLSTSYAATMNDYCITPPFVVSGVKPNLLLMLDNSASQYDLEYQDTGIYCGNDQTSSCTPGTTCSGTAYCIGSVTTTTTTTYSAIACTADSQCPNTPVTYTPKSCTKNGDCSSPGKCSAGFCTKCNTTSGGPNCVLAPKCQSGFCYCNTSTGIGDCTSTTNITYTPISCAADSTCSAITAGDTCNNKCNATRQCYDATYHTSTTYTGYFTTVDSSGSPVYYSYDLTNDKFTGGATMPGTCTYSAGTPKYVCVNTSGTPEEISETNGFVASGNFLNWLTASKFDIQKNILTGGKFDTTNSVLLAESRGCAGRKFIKAVSGVNLTFAIRGGTPGGIGSTQSLATEYGQTYIEIYTGTYNTTDCLNAMYDWMNYGSVNLGSFQNDTKGCVGAGNGQYNAVNVWNHILHDCYDGMNNQAQGYSTNLGPLEGECQNAYASGVAPSSITDPNSGIAICSSVLSYVDASGNPQIGYLGKCWNGTDFTGPCTPNALKQMENYCVVNVNTNPVIDPSSTVLPGSGSSAPGFILEQGLMNTIKVGTLVVKIGLTPAPTGLIDKYKNMIRFGAMTFNNNGSAAEAGSGKIPVAKACSSTQTRICFVDGDCPSGETCGALSDRDGSTIISYVGVGKCSVTTGTDCKVNNDCPDGETCNPWVGDHTSGLLNQIDSIVASTWTPLAEAFYNSIGYYTQNTNPSNGPARINSTVPMDFATSVEDSTKPNPIQYRCQKNNVLLITDGMSTADQNSAVMSFVTNHNNGGTYTGAVSPSIQTSPSYFGSINVDQLSWYGQSQPLTNPAITGTPIKPIMTHVVYSGTSCLFKDNDGSCCASGSLVSGKCATYADEKSVPERLMQLTAQNGGGTYTLAQNPKALYDALDKAFQSIAAGASSGTAASVLASGEGSGANLLQAIFYPSRTFDATEIKWTGSLQNFWYYVDPRIGNSSIREESNSARDAHNFVTATPALNLLDDHIVHFRFDGTNALADTFSDDSGNGVAGTPRGTKYLDETLSAINSSEPIRYLWEAGKKLYYRTDARTIYTTTTGATDSQFLLPDDVATAPDPVALRALLNVEQNNYNEANAVVQYVKGVDVKICDNSSQTGSKAICPPACTVAGETCQAYRNRTVIFKTGDTAAPWKLGDIINSTPKVASSVPLNLYHKVYNDRTYQKFISSPSYTDRGMVFVGANDGMLHAFNLGRLTLVNDNTAVKAKLDWPAGGSADDLGKESWAFIPKNALPYLKYMTQTDYNHLYYADATPYIFDASIGGGPNAQRDVNGLSWKTVLIGGMRYGGASRPYDPNCSTDHPHGVCAPSLDAAGNSVGYSSYFALDITDPTNPSIMWEFSDANLPVADRGLGFATSGPAVVRINGQTSLIPDPKTNGHWFVVFASGPSGPIETTSHQFQGQSTKNLKVYVLDLATGALLNAGKTDTEIQNAFSGALTNAAIDFDQNDSTKTGFYSDDALYFGYTQKDLSTGTWTKGGVLRFVTKESADVSNDWILSRVMDSLVDPEIGPVSAAISKLQNYDTNAVRLYFGTGRYYYKKAEQIDDPGDAGIRRKLYGVVEPCYKNYTSTGTHGFDTACSAKAGATFCIPLGNTNCGPLGDVTTDSTNEGSGGWYINLDLCTDSAGIEQPCPTVSGFKAERMVTDPLATGIGVVFFTTTKPTSDVCEYGGGTHFWAVQYDSGGAVRKGILRGRALIQVSTGIIAEKDLSTAFTQKKDFGAAEGKTVDNRRTDMISGVPPAGSPPGILIPPKPMNKIIHMKER